MTTIREQLNGKFLSFSYDCVKKCENQYSE